MLEVGGLVRHLHIMTQRSVDPHGVRVRENVGLTAVPLLRGDALLEFIYALQEPCEVGERDNDDAKVVHRLFVHGRHHHFVDSFAASLRHVLKRPWVLPCADYVLSLRACLINNDLDRILRADPVKNAVAADQNEV